MPTFLADNATDGLGQRCKDTIQLLLINHAFLLTVLTIFRFIKNHDFADAAFKILGMMTQIFCLIQSGYCTYSIYRKQALDGDITPTTKTIGTFFFVEMLVTTNIIIGNALFLLIRAFFKHKVHPEFKIEKKRQLQQIDTLKALSPLLDQFINMYVPTMTTLELVIVPLFPQTLTKIFRALIMLVACTGAWSFADIFMQMFVSWKKGPKMWVSFAPYLYFVNMHLTYLLFPCANTSLVVYIGIMQTS